MKYELLPCPFCGHQNQNIPKDEEDIFCNCGIQVSSYFHPAGEGRAATIDRWNDRVTKTNEIHESRRMTKHNLYICSDPHLGHGNIHEFRDGVTSAADNTRQFVKEYTERVGKRTVVWFLGDVSDGVERAQRRER